MSLRLHVTALEMRLDVPSDLGVVGDAVELVANRLPGGTLSPRRLSFNFRTALAEALENDDPVRAWNDFLSLLSWVDVAKHRLHVDVRMEG